MRGECNDDGGAACPSISWDIVVDNARGDVLQVTHTAAGDLAGVFIAATTPIDVSGFAGGSVAFDIKVVSGDSNITMKLDCVYPCTSADQVLGSKGASGWETVEVPFATLAAGGLDLTNVNTGIVIWASNATSTVFQIDNVRFTGFDETAPPPTGGYSITSYGAGSVSDTINPASYRCVVDYGNWIYNAGVVEPAIQACNQATGIPTGTPTPRYPQLTGSAANSPSPTHKWWGSIPFLGEMTIGDPNDAAYITPDPMTARVTDRGFRVMGIPSGLASTGDGFMYSIPDPFSEVFDGVAIGNTTFGNMDAYLKDHSDGSVTVEWQSAGQAVMEATFVHGSPYVYVKAYQGELVIRTLRTDSDEKGTFYEQGNSLGIWTSVAGNHNNFLVTGEGSTAYANIAGNEITVSNTANELTLTYLPQTTGIPTDVFTGFFEAMARNSVAAVDIDYSVDRSTNNVSVTHTYRDSQGTPVETIVGMHPLHWKNSAQPTSGYQVRSARGTIKFSQTETFDYQLPSVGILPALPSINGSFDQAKLEGLVNEFVAQGPTAWNNRTDTYWAGKNYGKVAELIAIADSIGMNVEATELADWLKSELADWFTAETNGNLDVVKYFVYDDEWNTLLGLEESFASHQQLNDHHFHYGYFIRAAAEICRRDIAWCGADQYGPMIELLIRDYAGDANDPMFPYLRNFDPANGFSWASGPANFVRGNNNESTSEAANAYGAIILYGLITARDDLVEKGMYLHASTAAAYWQYWNNIDGYNNPGTDEDNFPAGYNRIATSIIWGDGAVFSTWFSGAFAHILGIQGLPSNTLSLHVGQYAAYMIDYVTLGLSQSSNVRPSGLPDDQWRDLWWNLWSMTDADASIADYNTVADYVPEAGETKAHTYHWIHTFRELGQMVTGTGALTADYPGALAFDNNGRTSYVVYNFSGQALVVSFSDGQVVNAAPNGFTVITD
jgi:endoglucanase Acf2